MTQVPADSTVSRFGYQRSHYAACCAQQSVVFSAAAPPSTCSVLDLAILYVLRACTMRVWFRTMTAVANT